MSKKKSIWDQEETDEWVNFTEGVPVDIVIEDPQDFEKKTPWGDATVIVVRQFPRDQLVGGIRKLLRIEAKRLIKGIKQASPGGIPAAGNSYIITRSGKGFDTLYNVSYNGKFTLLEGGRREPGDEYQSTLEKPSKQGESVAKEDSL